MNDRDIALLLFDFDLRPVEPRPFLKFFPSTVEEIADELESLKSNLDSKESEGRIA